MAAVIIGNPGIGGVNAGSADDRYAGVGEVRSNGTAAARKEAGLITQQGYTDVPTYVVSFNVAATVAMDILTFYANGSKVLRLQRIVLVNPGSATAAAVVDLQLARGGGGPGSGGALVTARSLDHPSAARVAGVTGGSDADGGGVAVRSGDTTQAGGLVQVYDPLVTVSVPAAAGGFTPLVIYDASDARRKPVTISNSLGTYVWVLRTPAIGAGATGFRGYAEFTVDDA